MTVRLWGIDQGLDLSKRWTEALPIFEHQGALWRAMDYKWSTEDGAVRLEDEDDAHDSGTLLEVEEALEISPGQVVVVVGPDLLRALQSLEILPGAAWKEAQEGYHVCVASPRDSREMRRRAGQSAYPILCLELFRILRARDARLEGHNSLGMPLTPRASLSHLVMQGCLAHDPLELAVLDLLVAELRDDGGAGFTRGLAIHAVALGIQVGELAGLVGSRREVLIRNPPLQPVSRPVANPTVSRPASLLTSVG
ncbi:MAG: hypothetical protein R3B70_05900 [Polyangiaceae bacterium]